MAERISDWRAKRLFVVALLFQQPPVLPGHFSRHGKLVSQSQDRDGLVGMETDAVVVYALLAKGIEADQRNIGGELPHSGDLLAYPVFQNSRPQGAGKHQGGGRTANIPFEQRLFQCLSPRFDQLVR